MQIYWVQKAFDAESRQFQQSAFIALKNVAEDLSKFHNFTISSENPVKQISSSYFVVNVNSSIDANILEHFLKAEFTKSNINTDFEYAIYDCAQDKMVYGKYIKVLEEKSTINQKPLPAYNEYTYYFGVNFPNRTSYIIDQLEIWIIISVFLVLVLVFFGYSIFVILEQKRFSEMQKDFINNLTHEFKTPISTISIAISVLSEFEVMGDKQRFINYTNLLKEENERLNLQVEKVLQLNALKHKGSNLKFEKADFHLIVQEVLHSFKPHFEKLSVQIELELNAENHHILCDKVHISNLIYNLIDNALKYNIENPHIRISTKNEKSKLVIAIQDNGIGIAKEYQKKIFEPFFRISTGNLYKEKGFGVGLSYVKSILDAQKGSISVESALGLGSTFTIKLPTIHE